MCQSGFAVDNMMSWTIYEVYLGHSSGPRSRVHTCRWVHCEQSLEAVQGVMVREAKNTPAPPGLSTTAAGV